MSAEKKLVNKVRNNIFSITFIQIVSLVINIFVFGIVARILSVSDFGLFNYYLAIIGVTAKFLDLGINPIVLRETSKSGKYGEYLGTALILKGGLIILLLIAENIYFYFDNSPITIRVLANLFTVNIFLSNKYTNIRELLITPFKVALRMYTPMLLVLLDGVLLLILTLLINFFDNKLIAFTFAYVLANLPSTLLLLYLLFRKEKIKFSYNLGILKYVVKEALPIYGYVALLAAFRQMDTALIGAINGTRDVANYSVALRLSTPLLILVSSITMTFFPLLVKKLKNNEDIAKTISFLYSVIFVITISVFLLISFNSKFFLTLVFGTKYKSSSFALTVLSGSLIFASLNFFMVDLLTILSKQKFNFVYGLMLNLIALPLYFIILPKFTFNGAAVVRTFALFTGTLFLLYKVFSNVKVNTRFFKISVWLLLNIALFFVFSQFEFYFAIPLETIAIILTTLYSRIFNYEELELIFGMIKQEKLLHKLPFVR